MILHRTYKLTGVALLVLGLTATLSWAGAAPRLIEQGSTTIRDLPLQGNSPHVDMKDGYVGICTGDYPINQFSLINPRGEEQFTVQSPDGGPFVVVDMQSSSGVIGVAGLYADAYVVWYFYDYSGRKILGPIECGGSLQPSPGFAYLVTKYHEDMAPSARVYDSLGNLLVELERDGEYWELTPIDDTSMVFQDGNHIRILSFPSTSILREYHVDGIKPPRYFHSSLSSDGRFYAFSGLHKIAVCDLETGKVRMVEKSDIESEYIPGINATPRFVLSPAAEHVICYDPRGVVFTIYEYQDNEYVKVVDKMKVLVDAPVGFLYKTPFFLDDLCVINHFTGVPGGMVFAAYVFNYRTPVSLITGGATIVGYVSPPSVSNGLTLDVLFIDKDRPREAKIKRILVEEVDHE